jgi:hypothetical protein
MDPREQAGLHVFLESVWKHTTMPVNVTVLTPKLAEKLRIGTDGTNAFTTLRFGIPEVQNYSGWAIFCDGADMLLRADLADLWHQCDGNYAVKVVKHAYETKRPRKYVGTVLEAENASYPRKNWSSLILWNCGHWAHFRNRDKLLSGDGRYLHRFSWLEDREIGDIDPAWNHLVGEMPENPSAKLVHWTCGIPGFEYYRHAEHAREWQETLKQCAKGLQYLGR